MQAREAGYWGGMIIFAVCWPVILPLFASAYLVFYLISHGIMWICSPGYREKKEGSTNKSAAINKPRFIASVRRLCNDPPTQFAF